MNVALNSTICSMKKVFEELSNKLEAGASSSKDGSGGEAPAGKAVAK